jgi:hypothetical protein
MFLLRNIHSPPWLGLISGRLDTYTQHEIIWLSEKVTLNFKIY